MKQFRKALRVEPVLAEPWLAGRLETFSRENVRLIRSVPEDALEDIRSRVLQAVRKGRRAEAIAQERHDIPKNRARLIARDQVGKLYADLNRDRQIDAGVEGFIWRTMLDSHVCPMCAALEGKRFAWREPPPVGFPGDCHPDDRCLAEPDLDGWSEKL